MPGVDGIVSGLDTSSMIGAIAAWPPCPRRSWVSFAEMKKKRESIASLSAKFTDISKAIEEIDTKEKFEATSLTQLDTQFTANIEEEQSWDLRHSSHFTRCKRREVSQGFSDKETTGTPRGLYSITYGSTTTAHNDSSTRESRGTLNDYRNYLVRIRHR